jgi:hypothetical protein
VISGFRHELNENCALLVITQRIAVIPYRRFETTYRFHLQGSRKTGFLTFENGTEKLYRYVIKELPVLKA